MKKRNRRSIEVVNTPKNDTDDTSNPQDEAVEEVLGGDSRFHFDDGEHDDAGHSAGSDSEETHTEPRRGRKSSKSDKLGATDGTADAGSDNDVEADAEDVLTKVDIDEVRVRSDEADTGSTSAEIGFESARNRELFRTKFQSIIGRDTKPLEERGDFVLKLAQGKVKKRLKLLDEELQRLSKQKIQRIERTLFENQNHIVPHIDTISKERELRQLARAGVVELLNEVMNTKRREKQKQREIDDNPYSILKNYSYKLH